MMLIAAAGKGLIANVANAEDARVGVGVGPVGAGVTVGQSPRDERHTVVRERGICDPGPRKLLRILRLSACLTPMHCAADDPDWYPAGQSCRRLGAGHTEGWAARSSPLGFRIDRRL
jgi:hypothetical protein